MKEKVLLVDDDANVLAGYRRNLRKDFRLETAENGNDALELLSRDGPFAVVVSDMRMPGMSGVEFLREVRRQAPSSIRMMLTGNADLQTSIDAVNTGCIYRFLTKPCSVDDFASAIQAGLEQYRMHTLERELLHDTLSGCVGILTDILGLLNPEAFGRATRIRRYVRHIVAQLNLPHFWEYEMAATLSQIGQIALPGEITSNIAKDRPLTRIQERIVERHPLVAGHLLGKIPRLGMVARIIEKQNAPSKERIEPSCALSEAAAIELGGQILRVALDLDQILVRRIPFIRALAMLHTQYGPDHPIVDALMSFEKDSEDRVSMQITAAELSTGMIAADDIKSTSGHVLVLRGQNITETLLIHLQSCSQVGGLQEPFQVEVLANDPRAQSSLPSAYSNMLNSL